ncbi:unnamed protein product [Pleuronectes platessa]|uniref:Uncharacterized protein n=1 Tax=Pleuronectes platessa TaxID=8262 RepID=A0A9N7YF16_PLEPL|nr:unnamed protein product [Pleuronectes platessa]
MSALKPQKSMCWKEGTAREKDFSETNAHETRGNKCPSPAVPGSLCPAPPSPVPGHAAEARRGGLSSVGPRVAGTPERRGGRGERAPEPRSGGAHGGRGGLVKISETKEKEEGKREKQQTTTDMSLPTNCVYPPPSVQDRFFTARNGSFCGSPCAVNQPIDIVQKRRR